MNIEGIPNVYNQTVKKCYVTTSAYITSWTKLRPQLYTIFHLYNKIMDASPRHVFDFASTKELNVLSRS